MYVAIMGTGNALPSVDRANTTIALAAGKGQRVTLIDCGGDPYRNLVRTGVDARRLDDILITHAHIDHIGGLPSLIESLRIGERTERLRIFGNTHVLNVARRLIALYDFELTMDRWPFPIEFIEIATGQRHQVGAFSCQVLPTEHAIPSVGVRMSPIDEAQGPLVFGYTSDSVYTPLLQAIAQDATLFITEATYPRGAEDAARAVFHMTITQAATIAAEGRAKALALVHLSAPHYAERAVRSEACQAYKGNFVLPRDGTIIELHAFHGNAQARVLANLHQLP